MLTHSANMCNILQIILYCNLMLVITGAEKKLQALKKDN